MTGLICKLCDKPANTRGWCKSHYDAWVRTGDPTSYRGDRSGLSVWDRIQEIGWTRNAKTNCLEWNGYRNELGYGQFRAKPDEGGLLRVHRVAYSNLVGQLGANEHVLHKCDNPPCSEPTHLMKGEALENMKDMRAKRRGYKDDWTHCPNGHKYPDDYPASSTHNRCQECARERNRRYKLRKSAGKTPRHM